MHIKLWLENLKARDHSEDLGIDGNNIIIEHKEIRWEDVDQMNLAQDMGQWWSLVKSVIHHQVL
jgi:hypothetical protein